MFREAPSRERGFWSRIGGAAIGLAVILATALGILWFQARPAEPDAFYSRAIPDGAPPGDLIASQPFTQGVPAGARAWRILYATTRASGAPATASAVVMIGGRRDGPRDIIAWAHGTSGIARGCAPSVLDPFANMPALAELLAEGWAYVGTDYAGLGTTGPHAYLVGEEAARGVLDSVRAARRLPELQLSGRTVVWGHSQGGNAALWTGQRAPSLAPDAGVLGVAALAPASDLPRLLQAVQGTVIGRVMSSYALNAYAAVYPDVRPDELLRPGIGWLVRDVASRCLGDWRALVSVAQAVALPSDGILAGDLASSPFGRRMAQNTPQGPFAMPLLIAQGLADDLVTPAIQRDYASALCGRGETIAYRTYAGRDHVSLVAPASALTADLVAWTKERFAGRPVEPDCPKP